MKKWLLKNERILISDEWLKLKANTYQTANGVLLDPYYIYGFKDWANVVAITEDWQVVLVKQYRPGVDQICLELPSGCIEAGEAAMVGVLRELQEETGYISKTCYPTGVTSPNPSSHTNKNLCFLALGCTLSSKTNLDETEDIEVELVALKDLKQMAIEGAFLQSMHVASIFFALEKMDQIQKKLNSDF